MDWRFWKKRPPGQGELDPPRGLELRHTLALPITDHVLTSVCWSGGGAQVVVPTTEGTLKILDSRDASLRHALTHDRGNATCAAWGYDSLRLAVGYDDGAIRIWGAGGGLIQTMLGQGEPVRDVYWAPNAALLLTIRDRRDLLFWDGSGHARTLLESHHDILSVAWSPDSSRVAFGCRDGSISIVELSEGRWVGRMRAHRNGVQSLQWSHELGILSASSDATIRVWDPATKRERHIVEGVFGSVVRMEMSDDHRFVASTSDDLTVQVWDTQTWAAITSIDGFAYGFVSGHGLDPQSPCLCILRDNVVQTWELSRDILLDDKLAMNVTQYRNAKVVLVGDTGVGKSGLALALTDQLFMPTDSTHGRHVWIFDREESAVASESSEFRETLLWDLAGQPGYHLVHQMHLNEVALAVIVFDARDDSDPLRGVEYWARALRQAMKRQGDAAVRMRRFLVAARSDRGGVKLGERRISEAVERLELDRYFETSAKEGSQIADLRSAIRETIDWDSLPLVSSTPLFREIKAFLLEEKEKQRVLSRADTLFSHFMTGREQPETEELRRSFDTCISRLQNRDLLRALTFGDYVLLKPEVLDFYASAIVDAARKEPDEVGAISEESVLSGGFAAPSDSRVRDSKLENLLLIATVKELVDHDLAFCYSSSDGPLLVFPSQSRRTWDGSDDPIGKSITIRFEGATESIYATLAVRIARSRQFNADREDIWRDAIRFHAQGGGTCGVYLQRSSGGKGTLVVFHSSTVSQTTRQQFEDFVIAHVRDRSLEDSVLVSRVSSCDACGQPVPAAYSTGRINRGFDWIECGVCGERIPLQRVSEEAGARAAEAVAEMDSTAEKARRESSDALTLRGKQESGCYDVFLCYNSKEKREVRAIAERLKLRGIRPWFDEHEVPAGRSWVDVLERAIGNNSIHAAAICVGNAGIGKQQTLEVKAVLNRLHQRDRPIIPVFLESCVGNPDLPPLVEIFTPVDLREDPATGLENLIHGIADQRSYLREYDAPPTGA